MHNTFQVQNRQRLILEGRNSHIIIFEKRKGIECTVPPLGKEVEMKKKKVRGRVASNFLLSQKKAVI